MAAGRGTFDDNKVRDAVIVIIPKLQKNFGSPGRGNDRGELDGASRCVFWQISRETSSGNDEIGSVFDTAADVFLVVGQGAHDIDADDAARLRFLWHGGCGRRGREDWRLRDHARIPDRAQPGWAAEMTPIPPALATAPARDERLMPTPIPPWMMGYLAVRFPIFKFGNI